MMPRGTAVGVEVGVGDAVEVLDALVGVLGELKLAPDKLGELSCSDLALVMTGTCCLGEGDCFRPRTGDDRVSGVRVKGLGGCCW